jgi:hypothetical protein
MTELAELLLIAKDPDRPSFYRAEALYKLVESGLQQRSLATELTCSEAWISRMRKAYRVACPELREAWKEGFPIDLVFQAIRHDSLKQRSIIAAWRNNGRAAFVTVEALPKAPKANPQPMAVAVEANTASKAISTVEAFIRAKRKLPIYALGVYHGLLLARGDTVALDPTWARVLRVAKRLEKRR